uniref:DUF4228 domain-containing protein n=1 Tax=Cannabis sativa TaxID=3483 RepID=A0A803Q7D2_CANSA
MGLCYSCRSLSLSTTSNNRPEFKYVRVVHLNGYVECFEQPIPVSQVLEKPSKNFVCTPIELLSSGFRPLKPETLLQPGRIYFLLPYTTLQAEVSPIDLATLVKRLNAAATKTSRSGSIKSSSSGLLASPLSSQLIGSPSSIWSSPSWSPNRFAEPDCMSDLAQRSVRARSWKPILDTIREKSFHRRSESELQFESSKRFEV